MSNDIINVTTEDNYKENDCSENEYLENIRTQIKKFEQTKIINFWDGSKHVEIILDEKTELSEETKIKNLNIMYNEASEEFIKNYTDVSLRREIYIALYKNHFEIIKWFVSHGFNIKPIKGINDFLIVNNCTEHLRWLSENDAFGDYLRESTRYVMDEEHIECLTWLIDSGKSVKISEHVIHYACLSEKMIKWCLDHTDVIEFNIQKYFDTVPYRNNWSMTLNLLYAYCDSNSISLSTLELITRSIQENNTDIIQWILKNGIPFECNDDTLKELMRSDVSTLKWWMDNDLPIVPTDTKKFHFICHDVENYLLLIKNNVMDIHDISAYIEKVVENLVWETGRDIKILDWLVDQGIQIRWAGPAILVICERGNVETLNWIYEYSIKNNMNFEYTSLEIDLAISGCRTNILDWFVNHGMELKYTSTFPNIGYISDIAPVCPYLKMLKWWDASELDIKIDHNLINMISRCLRYDILEWILNNLKFPKLYTEDAFDFMDTEFNMGNTIYFPEIKCRSKLMPTIEVWLNCKTLTPSQMSDVKNHIDEFMKKNITRVNRVVEFYETKNEFGETNN